MLEVVLPYRHWLYVPLCDLGSQSAFHCQNFSDIACHGSQALIPENYRAITILTVVFVVLYAVDHLHCLSSYKQYWAAVQAFCKPAATLKA
jgi:hypothetical protein